MTNKPILFVHIPKTGGTSINNVLASQYRWNMPPVPFKNHQPLFVVEKYNNLANYHVFTVVRNPYKRAYSYYRHYQRMQHIELPFEEFLLLVQSKRKNVDQVKYLPLIMASDDRTPFIGFTQTFYTLTADGNVGVNKIYKVESLTELEQDLNISIPKINVGNYNDEMYYESYTQDMIDLVREIYAEDFTNFGYTTDFI